MRFLRACGARISGEGTPLLVIDGGRPLGGRGAPLPDRIAAATYAAALAAAAARLRSAAATLPFTGPFCAFCRNRRDRDPGRGLRAACPRPRRAAAGRGQTDRRRMARLCHRHRPAGRRRAADGRGESEIYDSLFANRFACAAGFAALGAGCTAQGRRLHIDGGAALHGADVTAPDLRGRCGAAVAALAAEGQTTLRDPGHIRRGYADLPGALGDCTAAHGAAVRPGRRAADFAALFYAKFLFCTLKKNLPILRFCPAKAQGPKRNFL